MGLLITNGIWSLEIRMLFMYLVALNILLKMILENLKELIIFCTQKTFFTYVKIETLGMYNRLNRASMAQLIIDVKALKNEV